MQGLQIKPGWQPAIPAERRSFTALFRPILPKLAEFHWIYEELPFRGGGGMDERFEQLIETVCAEGYIPPDTLLPRFAHYVVSDWAELYGFQARPDVATIRRRLRESPSDYEWLSKVTDLCFFNVDGAWWEMYARDERLLDAVRQHLTSSPEITVQERSLAQRNLLV
jgi:hypothetical protein